MSRPERCLIQPDLFTVGDVPAVQEVAVSSDSRWDPVRTVCPPSGRQGRDHALLATLLGGGDACCTFPEMAAGALLRRFGDLRRTMTADVADLSNIAGEPAARHIRFAYDLTLAVLEQPLRDRDVLSSWEGLKRYLVAAHSGRSREAFHVLFLDGGNRLIADECMGEGTVNAAPVYPREVIRRALQLGSSNLIIIHNHPGGSDIASRSDQEITKAIVTAAKTLDLTVHDHVIVVGDDLVSLRAKGLM